MGCGAGSTQWLRGVGRCPRVGRRECGGHGRWLHGGVWHAAAGCGMGSGHSTGHAHQLQLWGALSGPGVWCKATRGMWHAVRQEAAGLGMGSGHGAVSTRQLHGAGRNPRVWCRVRGTHGAQLRRGWCCGIAQGVAIVGGAPAGCSHVVQGMWGGWLQGMVRGEAMGWGALASCMVWGAALQCCAGCEAGHGTRVAWPQGKGVVHSCGA